MAQLVKNLPAMLEAWVQSPGEGKGLPTPVFWPGEFHGLYSPWGCKESVRLSDFHFLSDINFLAYLYFFGETMFLSHHDMGLLMSIYEQTKGKKEMLLC